MTPKKRPKGSPSDLTPLGLLRASIDAVPVMKYAVAVGGVAGLVSVVLLAWKVPGETAVFGTLIGIIFMVIMIIIGAIGKLKVPHLVPLALVLAWSFLVLTISVAALFVGCAFFDQPKTLPCLLKGDCEGVAPASTESEVVACSKLEVTASWDGTKAEREKDSCTYHAPKGCEIISHRIEKKSDNNGSVSASPTPTSLTVTVSAKAHGSVLDRKRGWMKVRVYATVRCQAN